MKQRAVCPFCDKEMAVEAPAGGDGTADVFPRHNKPSRGITSERAKDRCEGGRSIVEPDDYVRCGAEGSFVEDDVRIDPVVCDLPKGHEGNHRSLGHESAVRQGDGANG